MSVNKVFLLGRLGQDPKSGTSQSGKEYCRFTIATDKVPKGDEPDWHDVVAFGRNAQALGQYLHKGEQVWIEGRIQYGTYKDKPTVSIVVENFRFVGRPQKTEGKADVQYGEDGVPF